MGSRQLLRLLKDDGWVQIRSTGSRHHLKHPVKLGTVTVPHPKRDIPKGTVASVLRQAGMRGKE